MKETAERLMDLAEAHIRSAGYAAFSSEDDEIPLAGSRWKNLSAFVWANLAEDTKDSAVREGQR